MAEDNQERTHCTISAEEFSALCDDARTGLGGVVDEVEYLKGVRWRLRQFYSLDPSVPVEAKEGESVVMAYIKEIALLLVEPPGNQIS